VLEQVSTAGEMRLMYVCQVGEDSSAFYGLVLKGPPGWSSRRAWLGSNSNWKKVKSER